MTTTLEQFASECRTILKSEPGPSGRRQICMRLEELLKEPGFLAATLNDHTPERQVLYEDPELGFCILAHNYTGAKESNPHDHAHSWAIYGQAKGETEMTDWDLVERATHEKPGKVRRRRTYNLKPGMAYVYNVGDLHSPRREGSTKPSRIEGKNRENVKGLNYEKV